MRSRRASAPGPADGRFLSARRERDLRDDVPKLRGLGTLCLTPEKAAPGRNRACLNPPLRGIRARITSRPFVSKAPKEQLDVRKPSHLRNIGQHRPLVTPR
jgi:hypothetical protein